MSTSARAGPRDSTIGFDGHREADDGGFFQLDKMILRAAGPLVRVSYPTMAD
jgi:hypothetical protein